MSMIETGMDMLGIVGLGRGDRLYSVRGLVRQTFKIKDTLNGVMLESAVNFNDVLILLVRPC